jgi:hypothetical protein
VILYEILTGEKPFDDPSATSLAIQHLTKDPPPPHEINPNINPSTEAVLLKALSKSPPDRYPSGKALLDALVSAIAVPAETSPFIPAPMPVNGALDIPIHGLSQRAVEQVVSEQLDAQPPLTMEAPPMDMEAGGRLPRGPMAIYSAGCAILLVVALLISVVVFLSFNRDRGTVQANEPPLFQTGTVSGAIDTPNALMTATAADFAVTATQPVKIDLTQVANIATTQPPSPMPQDTAVPTAAPQQTEAPVENTPPPQKPGEVLFALYYNDTSFYIKNLSGNDLSIYSLSFDQLDKQDNPIYQFDGWRWANIYPRFRDGYCLVMEVLDRSNYLNPRECRDLHLVIHKPPSDRDYIFWTKEKGSKEFRVLWDDEEVGRCEIKEGYCEVRKPSGD